MSQWIRAGLAAGIKSTMYPDREERAPGVSPGFPLGGDYPEEVARKLADRCPTGALTAQGDHVAFDVRRCIHCYRCRDGEGAGIRWQEGYEWGNLAGAEAGPDRRLGRPFVRSLHILVVDAGDCGACLNEVRQLNGPYYNMHRLGFFVTPTPREADVLLVVGPLTDHMRVPLQKAYDAMPTPKRVVAVGTCALTGGVFGPSFVCGAGVGDLLPVDVEVPGQPPPPLAILHGLLLAAGRRRPAEPTSPRRPPGTPEIGAR